MSKISEPDIKKLWGRSAGLCAFPGCEVDCLPILSDNVAVIGEMAHIIAREPGGPRGDSERGSNDYDNLILLCPTHHTLIDKEPSTFSADELKKMKAEHEEELRRVRKTRTPASRENLLKEIRLLLAENQQLWKTWGPESDEAKRNPGSSAAEVWALRKLDRIVPNNRAIIDLLRSSNDLLSEHELRIAYEFIDHAEAFEANCYEPREGAPRFPRAFEEMVNG